MATGNGQREAQRGPAEAGLCWTGSGDRSGYCAAPGCCNIGPVGRDFSLPSTAIEFEGWGGGGGQGKEVDPSDNASTTIAPFAVWAVRASD